MTSEQQQVFSDRAMLGSFFGGKKDYQPVFPEGSSLIVPVADVPRTVAALAKSFRNDKGERVNIEHHWLITGTEPEVLNQARFSHTIGFHHSKRDVLDKVIDPTAETIPEVAYLDKANLLGVRFLTRTPAILETGFGDERSTFVSKKGHLILDRSFAGYLNPSLQRELSQFTGRPIEKVTDQDIISFILWHPNSMKLDYDNKKWTIQGEKMTIIPGSMFERITGIGTQYSNYPLRPIWEQMQENKYQGGERIVDGHIHEALTPRRIGGDPWLQKLADRYGPIKAAATLALFDVDQLMQMENLGPQFGVPWVQYAAREIFVIDDDGNVRAHSILNVDAMDDETFGRFIDVSKTSLSAPSNAEYRLKFHDLIQDLTTQKSVDEPMTPKDYAMLSSPSAPAASARNLNT